MKFKVRNWAVEIKRFEFPNQTPFYGGWLDYEGKSGRCGSGWTGNGVMVYHDGRISYDWPETVPNYLEEALLNKCKF